MTASHPSADANIEAAAKAMFRIFVRHTRPKANETETEAFDRRWKELPDRTRQEFMEMATVAYGILSH